MTPYRDRLEAGEYQAPKPKAPKTREPKPGEYTDPQPVAVDVAGDENGQST